MSGFIGLVVDLLLAVLLVATIVTSLHLSRRVARMKADEGTMASTIRDLVAAGETAERAVATLRATLNESETALAIRLAEARRHDAELAARIAAADAVAQRLEGGCVTGPASPVADADVATGSRSEDLARAVSAARQLAERATRRLDRQAA